jgi:oligopeptide/dipeptide ABC transporter ATP-binding protein
VTSTAEASVETNADDEGPLLDVRDLRTYFKTDDGIVKAVDGVSFSVKPGETLGVVGESGCGKSVTMMSILSLNPKPGRLRLDDRSTPGAQMQSFLRESKKYTSISTGQALFRGEDLLQASKRRLRKVRGSEISMIFQDPMTSLNPVHTVGDQLIEAVLMHRDVTSREARELAIEGLNEVGIPRAERRVDDYPHQFSGGMRQRVMIAMALINDPALLIADEPTTALDVTTQAQILGLMKQLQEEHGTAVVMITHDLGVIAEIADDVAVMYAARVAEQSPVYSLFERPLHPYTWGLLGSLPRLEVELERLTQIAGQPPSLLNPPSGCRFNPRCSYAFDRCLRELPEATPASFDPEHLDACFLDEATKVEESTRLAAALALAEETGMSVPPETRSP